ncbi:dipeptidyl peptidase 4-like isoform X3 [Scyliorhinus canicula]|uniref:dipeptidyl peptidase 4-like isoform X3 n=1 Tax=Scyliorhinus canicula TaxID=7830 RepID=UPI0018F31B41|nr:dipeptidyl peptidase 4-like isoform X3 [Scyliorhinus canicula]
MKTVLKAFLGVIAAVVVTIAIVVPVAVVFTNKPKWIHLDKYMVFQNQVQDQRPTFQLNDYLNGNFAYTSYILKWISDTEYLHKNEEGNVIRYNVDTKTSNDLILNTTFDEVKASFYLVSADAKFALLESNYSKLWRHSFTASYSIFDLKSRVFVTNANLPQEIQYISWAPVGHTLVYVWNNNIYLKTNPTSPAVPITTNGEKNKIYNGIPDWIYEEEMFSSNNAIWWSPNGRYFAYGEFNDTQVPHIEYSFYGDGQYPETVKIPYPKAGANSPTVKAFIVDVDTTMASELSVPEEFSLREYYLSLIKWVTDERISVQWIERRQNHSILTICDFNNVTWTCLKDRQFVETSRTGWIGVFQVTEPFFEADNIGFYKVISGNDGYKHIHKFAGNPPEVTAITTGKWEVISIVTLTKDALYYISNEYESYPGRRNLYKIKLGTSSLKQQCITCELMKEHCQYYSAYFSKNGKYYKLSCYGPGIPTFAIYSAINDKVVKSLEDNKELEDKLQNVQMPTKILRTLELDGINYWFQMVLPPHFDRSRKYPLLIDVYGGPGSQKADARFSANWATYLASTEGIIVASFDGRGSAYQGDKIMHAIYRRLGTYEVDDQIRATRKFIEMKFIDESRIAIWGWSYGGYVTSMVLGAGSSMFKCGMAIAPVSNWTYYDSMYTERYMGYPKEDDNLQFYKNSTVMERAENFKSVDYLLIHGTADDNVHFQQAAQISKALVDKQVDFQTMWYTDKDHGLSGLANSHVYIHMSHFLKQCFHLN